MTRDCTCGSGKEPAWVSDARGIEVALVCDDCRAKRLRGYRPEIFIDPHYQADEEIG